MGKSLRSVFMATAMPLLVSCGDYEDYPPNIIGPVNGEGYNINTTNQTATFPHPIQEYKIAMSEGAGYSIGLIVVQHPDNQTLAYFNDTYIKSIEFGGTEYTLDDLQYWDTLIDGTIAQRADFMAHKFSEAKGSPISHRNCDIGGNVYAHFTDDFNELEKKSIMHDLHGQENIVDYSFQQVTNEDSATLFFSKVDSTTSTGGNCEVSLSSSTRLINNPILINHEVLHAVFGIGHAGFYNACEDGEYEDSKIFTNDTRHYTLMSYFETVNHQTHPHAKTPTELDIKAMHLVAPARN